MQKMIDRIARDNLAELLHQFVAGRIENFEFEDRVPESSDPAIYEIWWNAAWPLYDDFKTHKLEGKWRIPNKHRRKIAKVVLFLKSDNEYLWPRTTGLQPYHVTILSLFTLGFYGRKKHSKDFDKEAWPFSYQTELNLATNDPPYLKAKNA